MNTRVEYLYRDASNYKQWGEVIFRGVCDDALRDRLTATLDSGTFFVAHQVRLPELFFTGALYADDHCFHELAEVSATEAPADDAFDRTIGQFVAEVRDAAAAGWAVFDPWVRRSGLFA
jgi:hypothetical protein